MSEVKRPMDPGLKSCDMDDASCMTHMSDVRYEIGVQPRFVALGPCQTHPGFTNVLMVSSNFEKLEKVAKSHGANPRFPLLRYPGMDN